MSLEKKPLNELEREIIGELIQSTRNELELTGDSVEWSLQQREQYNKTLAEKIIENKSNFNGSRVAVAEEVASNPRRSLDESLNDFFGNANAFVEAFKDESEKLAKSELVGVLKTMALIASVVGGFWAARQLIGK